MAKRVKAVIQFRRATSEEWEKVNPILRIGEPGMATDLNMYKLGDGVTPWNSLPYSEGKGSIFNADTHYDFPSVGTISTIYKANKEKKLYQWNDETLKYEELNSVGITDVELINGGDANGSY